MEKQKLSDDVFAPVSVVIPCFRCKDTIERALVSISDQTLKPAEVILVEDCSDDGTVEVLRNLALIYKPSWIKIIVLDKNAGPANARNVGWSAASHEFVAFLDSDDSWHPKKIEKQYTWMVLNPNVSLLGHKSLIISSNQKSEFESHDEQVDEYRRISVLELLLSNRFSTSSVMIRRNIALRFDENIRYCEDYDLWLRIISNSLECFVSLRSYTFMYKNPYGQSGLSSSLWLMQKGEFRAFKRLLIEKKMSIFLYFFVAGYSTLKFIKRCFIK